MPLTGIRVLDLTRLLPGPYATRLMAELGADVVKVEDPRGGDYARWMPPIAGDPPSSALFSEVNRGKRSVVLDLKNPAARKAFRVLASRSDVLMDSFRPGVLARSGLDPADLMRENHRLVYCALTGFGLTGPDAQRAGHDIGYLGRSGGLALSGPPETPVIGGIQVADIGASLAAVSGVLAALLERTRTGRGKVVDISLTEAGLAFGVANFGKLHGGEVPRRAREILDGSKPCYGVYRTRDGRFLAVGALEPKFWTAFLGAIELPELEPFGLDAGDGGARAKSRIQAKLLERTRDEWVSIFRDVEACVEPVLEMDEVEGDPHHKARRITDASGTLRSPIRVTDWASLRAAGGPEPRPLGRAPELGEHTESVLREAGVDDASIRELSSAPDGPTRDEA